MNNKIYNFTPKQRKKDLRFYKLSWRRGFGAPLDFLTDDYEWGIRAGWWHYQVPAWFKRIKNRKFRARCKARMRKQFRNEDYDGVFPKNKHDASWYYW